MAPEESLAALLCGNFSNIEVYAFVRTLQDGERIVQDLPEGFMSRRDYVAEATTILGRHGALDRSFFDALVQVKPKQRRAIQQVGALYVAGYTVPERRHHAPVSLAATVESLLAAGISAVIAVIAQETIHIVIAAAIAPLTLLRSPASIEEGRSEFISFHRAVEPAFMIRRFQTPDEVAPDWAPQFALVHYLMIPVESVFGAVATALGALYIRAAATLGNIVAGTRSFSSNWREAVFRNMIVSSVELVPGVGPLTIPVEDEKGDPRRIGLAHAALTALMLTAVTVILVALPVIFYIYYGENKYTVSMLCTVPLVLLFVGTRALSYVLYLLLVPFSFAVRLGVKSTWPVWAPLLYLSARPYEAALSAYELCDFCSNSHTWALIRRLAWAVLLLGAFKVYDVVRTPLWPAWAEDFAWATTPGTLAVFQVAAVLQATVALLVFYKFIDRAPINIRIGVWREVEFVGWMSWFFRWNRLLTFVTMTALFWRAICVSPG